MVDENIPVYYKECQVIDGSGMILTPGFVDQHVHLNWRRGRGAVFTPVPRKPGCPSS